MTKTCATCQHWQQDEGGKPVGDCYGVPPVISAGSSAFPQTRADDRCPLWSAIPAPAAEQSGPALRLDASDAEKPAFDPQNDPRNYRRPAPAESQAATPQRLVEALAYKVIIESDLLVVSAQTATVIARKIAAYVQDAGLLR